MVPPVAVSCSNGLMLALCLILVLIAATIGAAATAQALGLGRRLGGLDRPEPGLAHKAGATSVPNTGGIGIFTAFTLVAAAGFIAAWALPEGFWEAFGPGAAALADELRHHTPGALAWWLALLVMHLLGVIDDRRNLPAFPKLIVQCLVALYLATVLDLRIFHFLDAMLPGGEALSVLLSMLWIVTIVNAMNFLDNMDGLSAGVAAIIAALYLAAALLTGQWLVAGWCAVLVGILAGFLVFNVHPARIYMGDGGSLVLGLSLATASIVTTYHEWAQVEAVPVRVHALLMPLVLFAVPLYDFFSVVVLRLLQGRSPFVGDKQHFSHRLVERGLSVRQAVMLVWLCTIATGLGGVLFGQLKPWQAGLIAAQVGCIVAVLAMLEFAGWRRRQL